MTSFDMLSPETIAAGDATDAYFDRTVEALEYAGENPHVVAEVTASQFPSGDWNLFAGIEDAAHLLEGRAIDVDAIREGQLFDGGPVMRIEGPYLEFCRLETALLGFLSHPTGMATAGLETRVAAPDSLVLSFGSRHIHPTLAPMLERAALIAGLDGVSNVAGAKVLGREAGGTMPHALVISFGRNNQEQAWQAFDEAVGPEVPRIALCDTYSDEVEETLRAIEAIEDLDSVRIDTTGSRRGDFAHILKELRWKLDARGHEDIGMFASGGMGPESIRELRGIVDGFGVGGHMTDADPLDFALDIVEREGEPAAKRGKLDGRKQVYRTPDGGHHIGLADHEGPEGGEQLLEPLIRDGKIVREFDIDSARERALADAEQVGFGTDS
ncbi:nicotinate phosphoribosyltransferase [Halovenus sp. HT40]|uniref:nicotinate phosphoribosyltransferase n=1 Tax=Halovenus sp. HT40 TaxID=3126691 RepID=UPI00300F599B